MSASPLRITKTDPDEPIAPTASDDRGLFHLLRATYDPAARRHRWAGLATSGHRDLRIQASAFVADPNESPEHRLVACATGPRSAPIPAQAAHSTLSAQSKGPSPAR